MPSSNGKPGARRWTPNRQRLFLICLVSLTGCQASQVPNPVACDPTPPKIQWNETPDGGARLSRKGLGELVNYIHDLRDCARRYE